MLTFSSKTDTPALSVQPSLPPPDDSKIPFLFAAVPHKLFEYGLKPATIGVYTGLARYVNWKAQMSVDGRKVITGWTVPVSQQRLAELLNSSRQNMNHHIKLLVDAGVIELKRSDRGCYQYRLVAYKEGIAEIEQSNVTHPGVPTIEQVDTYAQEQAPRMQVGQSSNAGVKKYDTACQDLRHIKDMLRSIENKALSSDNETATDVPKSEDWREYQKYAEEFYSGNIRSQKLLQEASIYFGGKVDEYGICEDGFDVVWEMIPVIKQLGAKTHKAFDTEYGIRAFNKVMDRRDSQRKSSLPDKSDEPESVSVSEEPVDDIPTDSTSAVPPHKPEHIPTTAREAVAGQIFARHCLARIERGTEYTADEIEGLWTEAYKRFGAPENPDACLKDRSYLQERLVEMGITGFTY